MSSGSDSLPKTTHQGTASQAVAADAVRGQLDRILAAPEFAASARMSGFLSFVVNEKLEGRADRIKQYTIATRVFERERDFNQQLDPIVRVQAAKIRRAIQRYYLEEGRSDPVRIDIPKGTYVPTYAAQGATTNRPVVNAVLRPPTVAVMPFSNSTGDSTQEFLAAGFAEDLSTELSRFAGIAVVAFNTTRQCLGSDLDFCELARDLNADYFVSGSLRQAKPDLRLNAQVTDAQTGVQIWAERFHSKRSASEFHDVQEQILRSLTTQIAGTYGAINKVTAPSTRRKAHSSLSGYEAVLRALHFDKTMAEDDYVDALAALQCAVKSHPSYAPALARLAILELDRVGFGFDPNCDDLQVGFERARRAVALDPNSQDAQLAVSWAHLLHRDADAAKRSAWRMIELNPGDASLVGTGGWFLALAGERSKGMEVIDRSRRLDPNCPSWFHLIPFLELLDEGSFVEALHHANQIGLPDFFWDPLLKATSLGHLGRLDEATDALRRLLSLRPDFEEQAEFYVGCLVLSQSSRERILDGLSAAGLGTSIGA